MQNQLQDRQDRRRPDLARERIAGQRGTSRFAPIWPMAPRRSARKPTAMTPIVPARRVTGTDQVRGGQGSALEGNVLSFARMTNPRVSGSPSAEAT